MDGYPKKKSKEWHGQLYSETRFAVIKWLEKELPNVGGKVLNVAAGGWQVPRQLLDFTKVTKYITFDKKWYGDSKNKVDIRGDVHDMPKDWNNKWDCVICLESIECFDNPFKAMDEMYRVLKPGGIFIASCPFNYVWFGRGSNKESLKKKNPVKDYWRISKDGWDSLLGKFSKHTIEGFGGERDNDRFVYCVKGIK